MGTKLHEGDRRAEAVVGVVVDANGGRMARNTGHEVSPAIARKVEVMSAQGNSQEVIAFACDLDVKTLTKYYRTELEKGLLNANARVMSAIMTTAEGELVACVDCPEETPGKNDGKRCRTCHGTGMVWRREPNTTAQVWYSKNRMGWTDRERIEHVGDGGGPIITEQRSSADTIKARLLAIEKRLNPPANDERTGD